MTEFTSWKINTHSTQKRIRILTRLNFLNIVLSDTRSVKAEVDAVMQDGQRRSLEER